MASRSLVEYGIYERIDIDNDRFVAKIVSTYSKVDHNEILSQVAKPKSIQGHLAITIISN